MTRTLYEAASAIEAHMLADLLKQHGFSPQIVGEYLQGAAGELPAAGLVRLLIEDEEYAAAREVITQWEKAQPETSGTSVEPSKQTLGRMLYFFGGLLMGLAVMFAWVRTPVSEDGVDYNADGLLDEYWTYSPRGTLVKVDADRNLDKRLDYVASYDLKGLLESAQSDDNFDGKFETQLTFVRGNIESFQTDTDGDGYPDLVTNFQHGVLNTTHYRNPSTGLPLRVEHFRRGKLAYADIDADKNGVLDTRITFSALGDEVSRSPWAP
jgi:Putative prokaryotic signal transducing protein